SSDHTVQCDRTHRRLHKTNAFIPCDRKTFPVENGLVGGLLYIQLMRIDLLNGRMTADHVAIAWKGHDQARQGKLQESQADTEGSVRISKSTPPGTDRDPLRGLDGHRSRRLLLWKSLQLHEEKSLYKRYASEGLSRKNAWGKGSFNELQRITVD